MTWWAATSASYRELVKPMDDLRHDAVMEQVFGIVNVVPLTPTVRIVH